MIDRELRQAQSRCALVFVCRAEVLFHGFSLRPLPMRRRRRYSDSGCSGAAATTSPGYRLRSRTSYITGMKISVSMVENNIPPMTAIAIGERISAPSPQPSAIGTSPRTLLNIVIRIGRSRTSPASFSASRFE